MNEEFIICPICNYPKRNMTKHMKMQHGLSKEEYQKLYPDLPNVCKATSKAISDSLKNNWENDPEYRERCSSYWRSELHASRKSEEMKQKWIDGEFSDRVMTYSDEELLRRSEFMRDLSNKLWKDKDYRDRRRLSGQKQMLKNMKDPKFGISRRVIYNNGIYRSNLEVDCVKFLDYYNIKFEYETYKFKYVLDDQTEHYYIPDFYLVDYKLFLEVKPACKIDELAKLKANSVLESDYPILFVTEYSLSNYDKLFELINSVTSPITTEKL